MSLQPAPIWLMFQVVNDIHGRHAVRFMYSKRVLCNVTCFIIKKNTSIQFIIIINVAFYILECSVGFSRSWHSGCQSHCKCNKPDGSAKDLCDYCCKVENGKCIRKKTGIAICEKFLKKHIIYFV